MLRLHNSTGPAGAMIDRVVSPPFVARPVVGIALALLAFASFTFVDTVVKLLGNQYHLLQVMFLNSLFGLLAVCAIAHQQGGMRRVRTPRLKLHILRWAISFAGTLCVFHAFTRLPIANVYAVLFTAPLLITALSVPLLGETVGWRRWSAIVVGFSGVLVMLRPGSATFDETALFALLGALAQAFNLLLVRRLSRDDPPECFGFYGNIMSVLVAGVCIPFLWITPTPLHLLLLFIAGMIAGGGFWILANAFRHASAAIVAPFQYAQMPLGLAVGWLLFGTAPDTPMLIGAAIVIGSGLYVVQREAELAKRGKLQHG
jgi:drug/metabolite transporter (DMT)-like permease